MAQPPVDRFGGEGGERDDEDQGGEDGFHDAAVQELEAPDLGAHVVPDDEDLIVADGHGAPHPVPVGRLDVVPGGVSAVGVRTAPGEVARQRSGQLGPGPYVDVGRCRPRTGELPLGRDQPGEGPVVADAQPALPGRVVHQEADHGRDRAARGGGQGGDLPAQGAGIEEVHGVHAAAQPRTSL